MDMTKQNGTDLPTSNSSVAPELQSVAQGAEPDEITIMKVKFKGISGGVQQPAPTTFQNIVGDQVNAAKANPIRGITIK